MYEHHSSRRARALKQDTARQQRRRDRLKETGAPTTHVLNRAIAEGLFYWLDAERANGVPLSKAVISVQNVLVYARQVLSRSPHRRQLQRGKGRGARIRHAVFSR